MQDKIQEIMEMVFSAINDSLRYGMPADVDKIESKLRELVREPLSHKEACDLIAECEQDGPIYILRNTERAHGITNTSN